jgi:hypothetical protein
MSETKVRVRGIYATALTLLLAQRFTVVEPSEVIQTRLGFPFAPGPADVHIWDRPDRHGVVIEGIRSAVEAVFQYLRESIPCALFVATQARAKVNSPLAAAASLLARVEAEFPRPAKELLDAIRAKVVPTLPNHHLLKTIDPLRVDEVETKANPEALPELSRRLWAELVGPFYAPGKTVILWHLKAGEAPISQAGEVREYHEEKLVLRRTFRPGGLYDGLGLPKEEGDYGLFEIPTNEWWGIRRYFRADGSLLGELYNIHTPPELLPDGVRYWDLELDVVAVGGDIRVVDVAVLEKKVSAGVIPEALAKKAWETAEILVEKLKAKG